MIYILFLGFILRFINLNQSLWLDEAIGALVVKNMSLIDIATKFAIADNHPPLYYLLLKLWTNFAGYSEASLRMPSVIFGLGIVYLVYKITKNKYIAFLTATAPLLVYYSQEARMYIMAAFFVTLAVFLYLNKKYFLFSLSLVLLIFTDYVPVFLLPVFLIYSLLKKENVKKTILSYIPLLIVGIFWLPIFIKQMHTGQVLVQTLPAWQNIAGGATLKNLVLFWNKLILGRISFYPKNIYYLLIIFSSIPFLFALKHALNKKNSFYWLWFLFPVTFGFLGSFIFPAFSYFRFIYVVPAFYILVGMNKSKLLITLVILVNLVSLGIYYFDKNQQREGWKNAVRLVEKNNGKAAFIYPESFAPFKWYAGTDEIGLTKTISVKGYEDINLDSLKYTSGVYLFNYLEDLTDPNKITRNAIYDLGYKVIKTYTFNGVGEVEYLKK